MATCKREEFLKLSQRLFEHAFCGIGDDQDVVNRWQATAPNTDFRILSACVEKMAITIRVQPKVVLQRLSRVAGQFRDCIAYVGQIA